MEAGMAGRILLATGIVLAAVSSPGRAQTDSPGNPAFGRQVAADFCSDCHVVLPDQEQSRRQSAPNLVNRVRDPGVTEMALRSYLQTSHPQMPNVMLNREQTDDLVAYLLSLKERAP
jgi:mono/diheme cytochrome c family protein